ncbi:MAG TPA: OmpA family protein [Nitrospiria bacterium]
MNHLPFIRFGFVAVLSAALLSGCVTSSKYNQLAVASKAERDTLQGEIAALESQKEGLEQQMADLRKERDRADTEIAALNDRLADLGEQTEKLSAEKDQEIQRLKGTYEDLVKDLKGEIEKGEIKVTQMKNRLSVNLVEKILFNSGRADVNPKGKEILKKVGNILKGVKDKEIRIEGYTDNVPIGGALKERFPSNWELSTERAIHVLRFLQEETGVDGSKLSAVGYGEFHPIAENDTPEHRAQNRRIEIVLVPVIPDAKPMSSN